jgi:hypothetical protein
VTEFNIQQSKLITALYVILDELIETFMERENNNNVIATLTAEHAIPPKPTSVSSLPIIFGPCIRDSATDFENSRS